MRHHSWAHLIAEGNQLHLGQFEFGQKGQTVRNYRAPYILFKASPVRPSASGQAKDPLQPGDIGFDPLRLRLAFSSDSRTQGIRASSFSF